MILIIDNYDSFVFNLARYFRELACEVLVVRNDAISVTEIDSMSPAAIVLSPGPCTPTEAGICLDVVRTLSERIPMLGVCLGHQTIAAALGGEVIRAPEPVHGRTSQIEHNAVRLFDGLPNPMTATRYHSLVVRQESLPVCLRTTARTTDGLVMALEHVARPVFGVQFHPESILTVGGHRLLRNFLKLAGMPNNTVEDSRQLDRLELTETQATNPDDWSNVGVLHW